MIQSMTGYGSMVVAYKEKKIHVEIKSLNSKQLDLQTRIAPLYREKEMEMRQMVAEALIRGKVDMSVWIEKDTGVDATPVNTALMENYYQQLKTIAQKTGIPEPQDWMYTLTRMPDVLTKTDVETLDDAEWVVVRQAVADALQSLVNFRCQEELPCRRSLRRRSTTSPAFWLPSSPSRRVAWRRSRPASWTVCSRYPAWSTTRTAWSRS